MAISIQVNKRVLSIAPDSSWLQPHEARPAADCDMLSLASSICVCCFFGPEHSSLPISSHLCLIFLVNCSLSIRSQPKYPVWAAGLTPSRMGELLLLSEHISRHLIACLRDCLTLSGQGLDYSPLCVLSLAKRRSSVSVTRITDLSVGSSAERQMFLTLKMLTAGKITLKHN